MSIDEMVLAVERARLMLRAAERRAGDASDVVYYCRAAMAALDGVGDEGWRSQAPDAVLPAE